MAENSNGQSKAWLLNVARWAVEVAVIIVTITIWAQNTKTEQLLFQSRFDSYKEQQAQGERERRLRELEDDRKYDELVDRFHDLREELVARGVIDPRRSRRIITNRGAQEGD